MTKGSTKRNRARVPFTANELKLHHGRMKVLSGVRGNNGMRNSSDGVANWAAENFKNSEKTRRMYYAALNAKHATKAANRAAKNARRMLEEVLLQKNMVILSKTGVPQDVSAEALRVAVNSLEDIAMYFRN
jgi:hypothetical protein